MNDDNKPTREELPSEDNGHVDEDYQRTIPLPDYSQVEQFFTPIEAPVTEAIKPESGAYYLQLSISGRTRLIHFRDEEYITIGRFDTPMSNHLDLTPHNALENGISRFHGRLVDHKGTLHYVDTHSTNGSYLNGMRMKPEAPYALRDGDRLMLGRLLIRVYQGHPE